MENNFYLDFENRFRGSRSSVFEKLSCYDSLLQRISETLNEVRLLDVGCGRGEWLEKCSQYGFNCIGVEMNSASAQVCQDFGLNTINKDVFEVLSSCQDSSFDVISAFHFIEHIDHCKLIKFFEESKRVLSPSGVMILETPSIDNLIVSSRTFYLDPTHLTPINPDSISYIIESLGFDLVKYYYINNGPLHSAHDHNLTKVLNGIAEDILIVSTSSKLSTENIFVNDYKINWEDSFKESHSLLKSATLFDQENLRLRKRIDNIDESIYLIKKEIMLIQINIQRFSGFINRLKGFIIVRFGINLIKLLSKVKSKSRILFIKVVKLSLNRFKHLNFLFKLTSNNYCTKIFVYLLRKAGFNNIIIDKFLVKQKANSEYLNESIAYDKKLYARYQNSHNAKRIFDRINKK